MKTLADFMSAAGFKPNDAQLQAILHEGGPLYLPAGPGSGKTRVLLWRAFNLIVYCGVVPGRIFLSTFTEKAARQLESGLLSLLAMAGEEFGRPFDTTELYVGTLHSLSARILGDRRFQGGGARPRPPLLMDELGQLLYLYRGEGNRRLLEYAGRELGLSEPNEFYLRVQSCFQKAPQFPSRFESTNHLVTFFNRVSEEAPVLEDWKVKTEVLGLAAHHEGIRLLLDLYGVYLASLAENRRVDLSLIQKAACELLESAPPGKVAFEEVIIDEYQDTNSVQERLVFDLAAGSHRLTVVGDDDQALYRFRGATVENFVRFPERVRARWGVEARTVPIVKNYRSRGDIVRFYGESMKLDDWTSADGSVAYRVEKSIEAHRGLDGPAVFTTGKTVMEEASERCAVLVERIIASEKVEDPNRIAFLFPSVKSKAPAAFIAALEARGIKTYAPRAGSFLANEEALAVFGLIGKTIGFGRSGFMNKDYREWTDRAEAKADVIISSDPALALFITDKREELATSARDYGILSEIAAARGWALDSPYRAGTMKRAFAEANGISEKAARSLRSRYFDAIARRREEDGDPFTVEYTLSRATGLDWNLLDHFYRLCAFEPLRGAFDFAEGLRGAVDEGPICNLSLVSGYLARFGDEYGEYIGPSLAGGVLARLFFGSYLNVLYKLGQSDYEDPEDPFPRGRVSFLTIHQAKGLEFPVVFVPNTVRRARPRVCDALIEPFLGPDREPPALRGAFDEARRFYVAFSRAEDLLVVPRYSGHTGREAERLLESATDLGAFDPAGMPEAKRADADLPRSYSYTGDYTFYRQCPRRYMAFRKYGFAGSRTQHMLFGLLVHRTIEDLHRRLLEGKKAAGA
jgi:DNA helicase-2/ATP-dependent DNA helicase PcrA